MGRFDNIDWWCDSCGALLNNQLGFSDKKRVFMCHKCGYKNSISSNNIYRDKKSIKYDGKKISKKKEKSFLQDFADNLENGNSDSDHPFCPQCGK